MLRPKIAHLSRVISEPYYTVGVVSPPPCIGVQAGGSSAREVPRRVLAWPGLGGQGFGND